MKKLVAAFGFVSLLLSLQVGLPAGAKDSRMRVVAGRGTASPSWVTGVSEAARRGSAAAAARGHLRANVSRYRVDVDSLDVLEVIRDGATSTVRFAQTHRGVPVFGAQYLVHQSASNRGYRTTAVNGHYFTGLATPVVPRFGGDVAERLALLHKRDVAVTKVDNAGLTVLPGGPGRLVYDLTVWGSGTGGIPVKDRVFIDARSGALALTYNDLHTQTPVTGTGKSSLGPDLPLNLLEVDGRFRFRDETRSSFDPSSGVGAIQTHDAKGTDSTFATNQNLVVSNTQDPGAGPTRSGAVDAHYNAGLVFEYFEGLGRNSIDGFGMTILSVVNAADVGGAPLYNAFWDGTQMTYGNPDPANYHPFSAGLDVVAHELTHGVTDFSGGLVYLDQSGAMNEAYSDYFGNAVEVDHKGIAMTDPEAGFIGEDLCKTPTPAGPIACPLRDLNDGRTTDDHVFFLSTLDSGGVHLNSTIYAGALWNIREQLGGPVADEIVYKALVENTTPLDTFTDGRNAVVQAATTVLGDAAPEIAVIEEIFTDAGIVEGWDAAGTNDADILLENVIPLGFQVSAPATSGNRFAVASYDKPEDSCCLTENIYVGDLAGGPVQKMQGNPQAYNHELPDISGKRLAWVDVFFGASGFDADVVTGKIGGNDSRNVVATRAIDWFPSIDGKRVAWERIGAAGTDIYTRVLGKRVKKVTKAPGEQKAPSVSGSWVVWTDVGDGTDVSIRMKNMKNGRTVRVPYDSGASVGAVATNSTHAYWYADEDHDGVGGIYGVRLGKRKVKTIVPDDVDWSPAWTDPLGAPPPPSANDEYVAYTDAATYVNAVAGEPILGSEVGRDIWIVSTGGGPATKVTDNVGDQAYPGLGEGRRVAWLDTVLRKTDLMSRLVP
ncbi:MAG: M4 family metallopeptidase [Actinomycetota bacterium]